MAGCLVACRSTGKGGGRNIAINMFVCRTVGLRPCSLPCQLHSNSTPTPRSDSSSGPTGRVLFLLFMEGLPQGHHIIQLASNTCPNSCPHQTRHQKMHAYCKITHRSQGENSRFCLFFFLKPMISLRKVGDGIFCPGWLSTFHLG